MWQPNSAAGSDRLAEPHLAGCRGNSVSQSVIWGIALKFFYANTSPQAPPTFLLFVNRDEFFPNPTRKTWPASSAARLAMRLPVGVGAEAASPTVEPVRRKTGKSQPKASPRGRRKR
jgi:hypothetical protein